MVSSNISRVIALVGLSFFALIPARALAHCDAADGPVVKAAQRALDSRNPALVLIWVQEKDEPEIRNAFEQTLVVRGLSAQAKEMADRFFFETLVRVHRAGEEAPFTGLKPAGRDPGLAIPAADEAVLVGSLEPVNRLLTEAIRERLREQFAEVMATKGFRSDDVAAGRAYVKAYVEFIHFVERLYNSTMKAPHGHFEGGEAPSTHTEHGSHDRSGIQVTNEAVPARERSASLRNRRGTNATASPSCWTFRDHLR